MIDQITKQQRWDFQSRDRAERQRSSAPAEYDPQQMINVAGRWIGKHPILCVSAAMALGMVAGCLIKRR